ncbi:hypothetical protein PTT_04819 [Pyrenophora teres f. teres 0-1]|uniref:Uncharacterized protein n=1 Tax=Pyrenophora teres f. teres (strain 0-1) TaxID=861557 RepID=E3REN0_PYRTT|nr:hypothetical protein PTT_04819 [Pyrenophora teres f. teres 0-1]
MELTVDGGTQQQERGYFGDQSRLQPTSEAEHEPDASHPGPTPASAAHPSFCGMLLGTF